MTGHEKHRDRSRLRRARHVEAAAIRQRHIDQNEVDFRIAFQHRDRIGNAVDGGDDLIFLLGQQMLGIERDERLVLDDEETQDLTLFLPKHVPLHPRASRQRPPCDIRLLSHNTVRANRLQNILHGPHNDCISAAMSVPPKSASPSLRSGEAPQRIAKLLARAGIASRREIERMIADGRIAIDGTAIDTPATILTSLAGVTVDGDPVAPAEPARLFLFHKPRGVLTTEHDPAGRPTIYDRLPKDLPRLMPVGRLDLNTEGLLLMTTDGELKRLLELPATGVERAYRARAYGNVTQDQLEDLIEGVEIEGIRYGSIDANLERRTGANVWIEMILTEGKNREVRRVLEYLGLEVSRLIRTRYGPFILSDLPVGGIGEVRQADLAAFRKAPTSKTLQPVQTSVTPRPVAPRPAVSSAGATEPERPSSRPNRPPSLQKPRAPSSRPDAVAARPSPSGRGRMLRAETDTPASNGRPTRAPRGRPDDRVVDRTISTSPVRAKPDRPERAGHPANGRARGKQTDAIAKPARAARARAHRDATGMTTAAERPAQPPRGRRPAPRPGAKPARPPRTRK